MKWITQKYSIFSYIQLNSEPAEDSEKIEAHLSALQCECKKSSPSSAIIAEKLAHSFAYREKIVHEKLLSDILDIFPCFRMEKEVSYLPNTILNSVSTVGNNFLYYTVYMLAIIFTNCQPTNYLYKLMICS